MSQEADGFFQFAQADPKEEAVLESPEEVFQSIPEISKEAESPEEVFQSIPEILKEAESHVEVAQEFSKEAESHVEVAQEFSKEVESHVEVAQEFSKEAELEVAQSISEAKMQIDDDISPFHVHLEQKMETQEDLTLHFTQECTQDVPRDTCLINYGNQTFHGYGTTVRDVLLSCKDKLDIKKFLNGQAAMDVHLDYDNSNYITDDYDHDLSAHSIVELLFQNGFHKVVSDLIMDYYYTVTKHREVLLAIWKPVIINLNSTPRYECFIGFTHSKKPTSLNASELLQVQIEGCNLKSIICQLKSNLVHESTKVRIVAYIRMEGSDTLQFSPKGQVYATELYEINPDDYQTLEALRHWVIGQWVMNQKEAVCPFRMLQLYAGALRLCVLHQEIPFPKLKPRKLGDYVLWHSFGKTLHDSARFKLPPKLGSYYGYIKFQCGQAEINSEVPEKTLSIWQCTSAEFETLKSWYEQAYCSERFSKIIDMLKSVITIVPFSCKTESRLIETLLGLDVKFFRQRHTIIKMSVNQTLSRDYANVIPKLKTSRLLSNILSSQPEFIQQINWNHNELKGTVYPEQKKVFSHLVSNCKLQHSYELCPSYCPFRTLPYCLFDLNSVHDGSHSLLDLSETSSNFKRAFFFDCNEVALRFQETLRDACLLPIIEWMKNSKKPSVFSIPEGKKNMAVALFLISLTCLIRKTPLQIYSPGLSLNLPKSECKKYKVSNVVQAISTGKALDRSHILHPFFLDGVFEQFQNIFPVSFIESENCAKDLLELASKFEYLQVVDSRKLAQIVLLEEVVAKDLL